MRTKYLIAIVVAMASFVACQKNNLDEEYAGGDRIVKFVPSMADESEANSLTKSAVASADQSGLSLSATDGSFTLPMTCETSEGIILGGVSSQTSDGVATKGTLHNETGSDVSLGKYVDYFMVAAWNIPSSGDPVKVIPDGSASAFGSDYVSDGYQKVMKRTASDDSEYWMTVQPQTVDAFKTTLPNADDEYMWESGETKTFYAYANLPESGATMALLSKGAGQTMEYTVPAAASDQTDIMMGFYNGTGGGTGTAGIEFEHPLTAVKFLYGEIDDNPVIKSITLEGVAASGTAKMNSNGSISWEVAGFDFTVKQENASGLSVDTGSKLIGEPFILIPQDLESDNVTVTLVLGFEGKEDVKMEAKINTDEWQAGMTNTYTLGYSPQPEVKWIDLGIKADNGNTILWCDRNVVAIDASGVATLAGDIYSYNSVENAGLFDYSTAMTITSVTSSLPEGITGHLRLPTKDEGAALRNSTSSRSWGDESGLVYLSITGSTGEKIVFPASGFIPAKGVFGGQGTQVRVWTSTPNDGGKSAYRFYSDKGGSTGCNADNALDKYNVRLVFEVEKPELLTGMFSVSATEYVKFSRGNLQATYHTATSSYTWAFAANQYDFIGNAAGNTTIKDDGTNNDGAVVDLFGWSTGSTNYGISKSETDASYSGEFVDWGTAIDASGMSWYTLSGHGFEWRYLLSSRTDAAQKWGLTTLTTPGVKGLVILPDDWTLPEGCSFTAGNGSNYDTNKYDSDKWTKMEQAGAVFLPAAAIRYGVKINYLENGYYWSRTTSGSNDAYRVNFSANGTPSEDSIQGRSKGQSVRLVQKFDWPEPSYGMTGQTYNDGGTL